jgi:transposase
VPNGATFKVIIPPACEMIVHHCKLINTVWNTTNLDDPLVLPRKWVVERSFSWINQNRRMSKNYERLAATSEAFIYAAMTPLMVRRLARSQ